MSGPAPTPGGRRVDLHAHTTFSDGTLTPEALVARAIDKRLAALAITDHDTVEAVAHARVAAGTALQLVPGIEMSTAFEGADLHVLGYYVDPEHGPLRERLAALQEERRQRALAIVERLRDLGVPVDLDQVMELAGPGGVGRPNPEQALLDEVQQLYRGKVVVGRDLDVF